MTPSDFKSYTDSVIRMVVVCAGVALFWYALTISFDQKDPTLATALAQGALNLVTLIVGYWFGSSHRQPPQPDTTTITTTTTPPKD